MKPVDEFLVGDDVGAGDSQSLGQSSSESSVSPGGVRWQAAIPIAQAMWGLPPPVGEGDQHVEVIGSPVDSVP